MDPLIVLDTRSKFVYQRKEVKQIDAKVKNRQNPWFFWVVWV